MLLYGTKCGRVYTQDNGLVHIIRTIKKDMLKHINEHGLVSEQRHTQATILFNGQRRILRHTKKRIVETMLRFSQARTTPTI